MAGLSKRIDRLEKLVKPAPAPALRVVDRQQIDGNPGLALMHKGKVTMLVGGISYDDI
jgi:hypothetical protein